jgi:sulfatase modifying factor 1
MINKILLFVLCAVISLSFMYRSPKQSDDKKDMVKIAQSQYTMGIDSVQRKNYASRFNVPESFFLPDFPAMRYAVSAFYIDKYEVTNAAFKKFIDANPSWSKGRIANNFQNGDYLKDWKGDNYPKGKADYPVTYVSGYAANAYARWVGKRLPTESEWEYVAKYQQKDPGFPSGNDDADKNLANYAKSGLNHTVKVGSYPPNALGVYDMAGNVAEMCADLWRANKYARFTASDRNQKVLPRTPQIVIRDSICVRGGSWGSQPVELLPFYREGQPLKECSPYVGFRCANNATSNPASDHIW